MTVAEMIEWLKTQDQNAVVYIVSHEMEGHGSVVKVEAFDSVRYSDYVYYACEATPELLLGKFEVNLAH